MDKRLIWAVKSLSASKSRKAFDELLNSPSLYDGENLQKFDAYESVMRSFEEAQRRGYSIVTYIDADYPESLKHLASPPPVIYIRGNKNAINHRLYTGIVGSRKCDEYGLRIAHNFASDIAQTGVGIITGGAEGVDGAANKGALSAHGTTIAVFGSGLDVVYPKCNRALFDKIEENGGAIISEFACGTPPDGRNFPIRNRIIAAMSESLAVIRAGARSGALITAHIANDMGKTVYSLPGNIDNHLSMGTNNLIVDGANILLSSMDIIDELIERYPDFFSKKEEEIKQDYIPVKIEKEVKEQRIMGLSEYEMQIINAIKSGKSYVSEIEEEIAFETSRLTAILGMLELKGIIKKGIDKKYRIITGGNS